MKPNLIEEIEAELESLKRLPTKEEEEVSLGLMFETEERRSFAMKSPERIAKLVEYVKAAEEWFLESEEVNHLDLDGNLDKARKALGLTED